MAFLSDWTFWAWVISLTALGFQMIANQKIKNNDQKHLEDDVKKISEKQDIQEITLNKINTNLAYIRGKVETEERVTKVLERTLDTLNN